MTRSPLLDRRLVVVTGKGGVGKTTVAAALCRLAIEQGKSVLACSMDGRPALADALAPARTVTVGFEPVPLAERLDVMAMEPEAALREYLRLYARIPSFVSSIAPLAAVFDYAATAAPGVREILAVGKICHEVRRAHHDVVIVDAEATGHVLGQLTSPRTLEGIVTLGMIRDQTEWMSDILEDPTTTSVVVVAVPEELATTEATDLVVGLRESARVEVGAVVCNKMPEPVFAGAESGDANLAARLDELARGAATTGGSGGTGALLVDALARFESARLRRAVAERHALSLRESAGAASFAVLAEQRRDVVEAVAAALAEEQL